MGIIESVRAPRSIDELRRTVNAIVRDHLADYGRIESGGYLTTQFEMARTCDSRAFNAMLAVVDLERHPDAERFIEKYLDDGAPSVESVGSYDHPHPAARPEAVDLLVATPAEKEIAKWCARALSLGVSAEDVIARLGDVTVELAKEQAAKAKPFFDQSIAATPPPTMEDSGGVAVLDARALTEDEIKLLNFCNQRELSFDDVHDALAVAYRDKLNAEEDPNVDSYVALRGFKDQLGSVLESQMDYVGGPIRFLTLNHANPHAWSWDIEAIIDGKQARAELTLRQSE